MIRWSSALILALTGLVACKSPVIRATDLPASSASWRLDSLRVRRADAPRNPCRSLEEYRERFFVKVAGSRKCSDLLDEYEGWKLHYRLVRTRVPSLQFERLDGVSQGLQDLQDPELAELSACFEKGPLQSIPIPAEIAVLSETSNDGQWARLECHRVALNLLQDEFLEAKMRMPLMKVSVGAGEEPWLFRLWMAPFVDGRGVSEGWLQSSLLPSGSCQLCLKKAWRDHEKSRP